MGGVIFVFLLALLIVILVLPAVRAELDKRRAMRRGGVAETPHEAVIRRLDDHRTRRANKPTNDKAEPGPDA